MRISWIIISILTVSGLIYPALAEESPVRVGWIGAMTGPIAKYGPYESAILAQEEINARGGINGRPLELIFEDGMGQGNAAARAAQKLISANKVKYIIGGHCSPESLAIAPLAQRNRVIMLAAITSNPMLTHAGDHVFRLTAVSTVHADLLATYALSDLKLKRLAVLYEETDYAEPPAERFAELIKKSDAELVDFQGYHPGETDFRAVLTRLRNRQPDGLYLGVQSPDSAVLILQQLRELNIDIQIFGNEITGNAVFSDLPRAHLFDGMIFGEPDFDLESPATKAFVANYTKRFQVDALPYGFWSAEAYDAVKLLAQIIGECGDEVEQVRACLLNVRDYPGVSAPVSIDENGDGVREYKIKIIEGGSVRTLR